MVIGGHRAKKPYPGVLKRTFESFRGFISTILFDNGYRQDVPTDWIVESIVEVDQKKKDLAMVRDDILKIFGMDTKCSTIVGDQPETEWSKRDSFNVRHQRETLMTLAGFTNKEKRENRFQHRRLTSLSPMMTSLMDEIDASDRDCASRRARQ